MPGKRRNQKKHHHEEADENTVVSPEANRAAPAAVDVEEQQQQQQHVEEQSAPVAVNEGGEQDDKRADEEAPPVAAVEKQQQQQQSSPAENDEKHKEMSPAERSSTQEESSEVIVDESTAAAPAPAASPPQEAPAPAVAAPPSKTAAVSSSPKKEQKKKEPAAAAAAAAAASVGAASAAAADEAVSSSRQPQQRPPASLVVEIQLGSNSSCGGESEEAQDKHESYFGQIRSDIYDNLIVAMTSRWYRTFLCKLPANAHVLDVGIGTATALIANKDILVQRNLSVIGVDYDAHYVVAAKANVKTAGLSDRVSLVCASIHDYSPPAAAAGEESYKFDAVYFSGSFMIIPNKADALRRCRKFLVENTGKFFFTQSFEHRGVVGSLVNMAVKPLLKLTTSIDFGSVTYMDEFDKTLTEADVKVESFEIISAGSFRDEALVIAK